MIHWNLRNHLKDLRQGERLFVFMSIYLRRNLRNRAWPTNRTIMRENDLASATVSKAIAWMRDHQMIVLVPYDKRIGEELKLPNRKNIYQLTGVVVLDGKAHPYMHLTPEGWAGIIEELQNLGQSEIIAQIFDCSSGEQLKVHGVNNSPGEPKVFKGTAFKGSTNSLSPDGDTDEPAPKAKKPRVPKAQIDPMKNALAAAFAWSNPTEAEWGIISKAAKELCLAGLKPGEVPLVYQYCADNFDHFGPRALATNLSAWQTTRTTGSTSAGQSSSRWAKKEVDNHFPIYDHNGKWLGYYDELVKQATAAGEDPAAFIERMKADE